MSADDHQARRYKNDRLDVQVFVSNGGRRSGGRRGGGSPRARVQLVKSARALDRALSMQIAAHR